MAAALAPPAAAEAPRFSFAVLTDIQYADKDTAGRRDYRASLGKLREAVAAVNAARPAFALQLGDLVDEGERNFAPILKVWNTLAVPRHHVLGNHDFCAPRDVVLRHLGMPSAWYDFSQSGWRFVVLDGMDLSITGRDAGSRQHTLAVDMLASLRQKGLPNAMEWNGGISDEQQRWLRETLRSAEEKHERVIVLCHFPVWKDASTPQHLLWNANAILELLDGAPAVAAWLNGHDHNGGYALRPNGVHFVTFPGMVESGARNSWTMVEVYENRLELRGFGTAPSRTLRLRK